ncbi:MAG TPA: nucleotidyl transferase AbiEii/AbiGii toxin family protein, partial [Gammaproteobacteria bacterium]|nr:nucleotidyl transferase AbiEii/AbiGii toxin family protein [Gammaproteobacteria bacterium]
MAKKIKNIGASVRARLLGLSRANGQSFDLVLTRFALERLLFRLSQSRYAERFVLKGAMLLMIWFENPHRGTRDLDLLGFGDPSPDAMLATFREILAQDTGDGVAFDADALR